MYSDKDYEEQIRELQNLMGRYVNHVVMHEGVDFIDEYESTEWLSHDEMKEIRQYAKEAKCSERKG